MKNQLLITIILALLYSANSFSQTIHGHITDENHSPLIGATIHISGTTIGTTTDKNGKFSLEVDTLPVNLVTSYVGYKNDTTMVSTTKELHIHLKSSINLQQVEIEGHQTTTNINSISSIHVESIGSGELKKAACCNLSESFETNASVDVVYSDAVSGAKKIQMLGLDGSYSQIMFENLPLIRGLGSSYGLSYIPGTWLESIQITKGAGSIVNGYESMTGQLNLEFLKPRNADRLFVNLYGNMNGRSELNIHLSQRINSKWNSMLFLHGNNTGIKNDKNHDGFLDLSTGSQLNALNRWERSGEKTETQFGIKALVDDKTGGQVVPQNPSDIIKKYYKVGINTTQIEGFAKNGFLFPHVPYKSVGLIGSIRYYNQDAFFGDKTYKGNQVSGYFNAIYQDIILTSFHKIKTGVSYQYDKYAESYNDSGFYRTESVPGTFLEYTYSDSGKISLVAGLRSDFHNLYGTLLSPRIHFKYSIKPLTTIRLSIGKGFRTANVFAENSAILTSSRLVIVKEKFKPEESINAGISFIHKFYLFDKDVSFSADYYRTEFLNQIVVDLDKNAQEVQFYNLKGKSYSNSFQADFSIELIKKLDVKIAYKFNDVWTNYSGTMKQKPYIPQNRVLINGAYATTNRKWKFDYTINWFGKSRLPNTETNPAEYRNKQYSSTYFTHNAQITRVFKHFEIYLGGENIYNYKQQNPIISANDPFGKYFDASMIWGPIIGRMIYFGGRYTLKYN